MNKELARSWNKYVDQLERHCPKDLKFGMLSRCLHFYGLFQAGIDAKEVMQKVGDLAKDESLSADDRVNAVHQMAVQS